MLLQFRAGSLNFRDLLVVRATGRWAPVPGRILGSDATGEILAMGAEVEGFRIGDRVVPAFLPKWIDGPLTAAKSGGSYGGAVRDGLFAERFLLDAASVARVPDALSDAQAASLVCAGLTAWHALSRAGSLCPGATVVVQGTGGVSMLALQIAAAAGARVFATSSDDAKLERATALGAAHGIQYRRTPNWDAEVVRLNDGLGVDHVVDIGGAATLERSIAAVRYEGFVSSVGLVGGIRAEIDVSTLFLKNVNLHGVETGSLAMLRQLLGWASERGLRPSIAASFPFEHAPDAFAALEDQRLVGKICLTA